MSRYSDNGEIIAIGSSHLGDLALKPGCQVATDNVRKYIPVVDPDIRGPVLVRSQVVAEPKKQVATTVVSQGGKMPGNFRSLEIVSKVEPSLALDA